MIKNGILKLNNIIICGLLIIMVVILKHWNSYTNITITKKAKDSIDNTIANIAAGEFFGGKNDHEKSRKKRKKTRRKIKKKKKE